jgi:hypothetical protein
MIITTGNGPRWLFLTELPDERWAVWTATPESIDSIQIQRIRNRHDTSPGQWWKHSGPQLPHGMIGFRFDQEPSLDYVRRNLPPEWSQLWDAIEAEYTDWAGGRAEHAVTAP